MISAEIIKNFEDKEISDIVLQYYDLADGSSLGLQQCLEEVKQLKYYIGDRKFSKFVEIGCDEGGSLYLFSKLFLEPGAHIYTIDLNFTPAAHKVIQRLANEGYNVHPVNSHSQDVNLAGFKCDLLHIDGDHAYKSVRDDFDKYFPTLIPGGICLLHDTLLLEGAKKVRAELERHFDTKTFKGYTLVSGDFYVKPENDEPKSTGITLVHQMTL